VKGIEMSRILVVDDEPLIAMLAEEWLGELGHDVVGPAHNLHAGLELAREPIDGAIVDVSLGKDSGCEIANLLFLKGIPFIFATGHSLPENRLGSKPAAILTKPFQFDAFRLAVQAMVGSTTSAE